MSLLAHAIIFILSTVGLLLCLYIHHKKAGNQPLVCPIKSDCNKVVKSEYSRILGVPLEVIGALYYGSTAVFSIASTFIEVGNVQPEAIWLALLASSSALAFSLILTFIQAFVIREWCVWCLGSAFITLVIFMVEMIGFNMISITI